MLAIVGIFNCLNKLFTLYSLASIYYKKMKEMWKLYQSVCDKHKLAKWHRLK
uniref:Uncharacterized protein n=1 Tax=Arsenophonus nasoniae TaxID=638 RepID=D2TXK3_9GAMM|nr:hypothetical protein ARN_08280 [Arsenophonus nasoniae]